MQLNGDERQRHLAIALAKVRLPPDINIRPWSEADFPAIQRLSLAEGWNSPTQNPTGRLLAWQHSWPALVAVERDEVVGFVRGLTDGAITIYIAEMVIDMRRRGRGIGRTLLSVCHALYPTTRVDLLAADTASAFYQACGFSVIVDGMRKSHL